MRRKDWLICAGTASFLAAYLYLLVDSPTVSKEATKVAQDSAMHFLLHPNEGTIKISGNRKLIEGCVAPHLETTYSLSEKGRFEFRVLCADRPHAFILVAMRRAPPDFMVVSQTSTFGAEP